MAALLWSIYLADEPPAPPLPPTHQEAGGDEIARIERACADEIAHFANRPERQAEIERTCEVRLAELAQWLG